MKLIFGNKLVKDLHWGINKSTFEPFGTSFPSPSKTSQLECLFTISNHKLPVSSFRLRFWGPGHATSNLQDQHLIYKRTQQVPSVIMKAPSTVNYFEEWSYLLTPFTLLRACSHKPGQWTTPGQALPRVHMMIWCLGQRCPGSTSLPWAS